MRTRKADFIGDEVAPMAITIMKEGRKKYDYSLEDLSRALNYSKNRQTLHKYETGKLNIPYDVFFDICRVFNVDNLLDVIPDTVSGKNEFEKRLVKEYVRGMNKDRKMTSFDEKTMLIYKNASYDNMVLNGSLVIKLLDDSMSPVYEKGDKIYFKKQSEYSTGDDVVVAIKPNILAVRRLYRYPKGLILQAMNSKHQTVNVNVLSSDMILGKVKGMFRDIK
ncbi:MAG: XRE family transcriptional regulator [bacterium]|nr:XRE family transcriptional regulator [bacterium]